MFCFRSRRGGTQGTDTGTGEPPPWQRNKALGLGASINSFYLRPQTSLKTRGVFGAIRSAVRVLASGGGTEPLPDAMPLAYLHGNLVSGTK